MFTFKAIRAIGVLTIFSLIPLTTLTQVQNPTQTPAPSPPISTQADVVRVSTELVQTDVTVIDKQGHFVDGLSRDKFELFVDGKPQTIAFFERVTAGSSKEASLVASASKASAPPSEEKTANSTPPSSVVSDRGRTTLFFIDDLHLSHGSMKRTQDLLLKFVNQGMRPKDQALIGTASGQLGFLQQVTNNRDALRTAIDRLRYRPSDIADTLTTPAMNEYQAIAIENNNRDAVGYFTDKQCEEFKRMGRGSCAADSGMTNNAVYDDAVARNRSGSTTGTSPGPITVGEPGRNRSVDNQLRPEAERMVRARARMIARLSQNVTLNTLNSLESLIRSTGRIPERKLVILVSDGFFLNLSETTSGYDIRRITDAALRSGTVIYTIDARGLVGGGPDASTKDGMDPAGRFTRLTMSEITALQDGLNALANDTGGRAWRNSNDLAPGIGQALEETSTYYLLAWRPEGPAQARDSFRRIEVRIKDRSDLTVRVRSGFFAKDPADSKASEATRALSDDDQLLGAIRAAHPRQGIPLALSLGYLDKADEGIVVAASVQIDLNAEQPGAEKTISESELNMIGAVIDDRGNILSSLKQKVTIPASDAARSGSMVLTLQFPKLAPGLRQVRIAARDSKSGRLGSTWQWIEIPNLASEGLTLSSIFLSDGSTAGSQKPAIRADGLFTQAAKLRFQTYVYNANRAGSKPNLALQLELRRDGQTVIQTPPSPVTTEGVTDLARIPVVGEFPLASFPPGQYELSLLVTDQSSSKSASRRTTFSIR